jgi:hypothetical protein
MSSRVVDVADVVRRAGCLDNGHLGPERHGLRLHLRLPRSLRFSQRRVQCSPCLQYAPPLQACCAARRIGVV